MTTVSPQSFAHAVSAPGGNASAPTALQGQTWLRELELARWRAQPRYELAPGGVGADGEAGASGHPDQGEVAGAVRPADSAGEACGGGKGDTAAATGFDAALASEIDLPSLPLRPGEARAVAQTVPTGRQADSDADALASRAATCEKEAAVHPRLPALWQQRSVHVFVGEQATSVWIRDARLQTEEALQVLESLNTARADVRDAGRPVQLNLNGHPVKRGDRA